MPDPVPFQRPINWTRLRSNEAERVIKDRAKNTENVEISLHAYDRIGERSILAGDVYRILQEGTVEGAPVLEDGEWKVIMVKRMPGTRTAGVVTLIIADNNEVFVKTVEWMDWIR
ncbi:DUF4258 domain-containing protein [Azospirillum agricola]|uniref:DUF4258 domain-containing protein n=1 Tax=Azospirillum agricola TaxID=1720247 RepID=UPI000A0F1C9B|nr:DUF4258 domain-containing protein [Azospirillum agricola]SMH29514.1 hypothetical protein SAMN02982994_0195 [Azospirillum lipoferum]